MADVLARIVERKKAEVAERLNGPVPAEPTPRSLRAAMTRPGARFIMEVKRRSPSGHVARHSLEQAVAAYAPVADAISVLTDSADFGGSFDDLRAVRARFDGPILAKDFIVDAAQVSEARAAGADAVLVMLSVLEDAGAAAVMDEARRFGMDALVEVHDEDELARAIALGASLIGINNRDLKTLTTDLSVTERLAPHVPKGIVLIAESGVVERADVQRLAPLVDGFLVGSSLMAADNIGQAARALVHGRVKLCGLTRVEDVALAAESGATHAGIIFHPRSPRRVTLEQGRLLASAARNAGLKCVGVFAGDDERIASIAHDLGLGAVQVHGDVPQDLKNRLGSVELIGAVPCGAHGVGDVNENADRHLFDHGAGGTGTAFDWRLLDGNAALPSAFIAGGIGPDNAREAARLGAYGIDVSSRVEQSPGIKDRKKVEALFAALRPQARGDR